ncbi:hypothetical protein SAMN05216464_10477 [Mucilaginibacter pineti]|uniref:Uncharacterized protein n=1 Tax=Mucilaginibacter pineti TaxID=1391627 RepID=A0A1G7AI19_9SPHI|nr:hypothetical protein [Mucilaginibacter pineti]SDE13526.1 hypothetical protein SAMN05216464_10477 [Mucilaginibacter pineti]
MSEDITVTLAFVSTMSGFIPVLAALYNYKHLDKVLKIAALFFLISCTFDPIMWIMVNLGEKNNMPMMHVNVATSLVFYTLIYYCLFNNAVLKKVTLAIAAITLTIMLAFNHDIHQYPTVSNTALSISLIVLSLIYFYQLLNPLKFVDIEKQGLFWINAGVLFYSSVNIFLFMILTQIPVDVQKNYLVINSITNIIANILFSVGLLCKPQKTA